MMSAEYRAGARPKPVRAGAQAAGRADLMGHFECQLLLQMQARGAEALVPWLRQQDEGMALKPWIGHCNFNRGHLARGMALLPRQDCQVPGVRSQNDAAERLKLPAADLDDGPRVVR